MVWADFLNLIQCMHVALKEVQRAYPSYPKGAEHWWTEVIRKTALGAIVGLDPRGVFPPKRNRTGRASSETIQNLTRRFQQLCNAS